MFGFEKLRSAAKSALTPSTYDLERLRHVVDPSVEDTTMVSAATGAFDERAESYRASGIQKGRAKLIGDFATEVIVLRRREAHLAQDAARYPAPPLPPAV